MSSLRKIAKMRETSPFDLVTRTDPIRRHLHGCKEPCSACRGRGRCSGGCCVACGGTGRSGVLGGDLERKANILSRAGTLLVVGVDLSPLDPKKRVRVARVLERVVPDRVASRGKRYYTHTPKLMETLLQYDIPYRTVNYKHPSYGK